MTGKNGRLTHKKAIRFSDAEQKIIDKVRDGFELSSDSDAVRFVLNFWWKTLGSDAVDVKKLGKLLSKGDEDEKTHTTEG
jgi:sulfur relay (sulfurtransferase) DsrC/TusE family protein